MKNKSCVVIAGPTAVGKTSLAIQIARYFKTQIISADSRQCYRELNIGVAKPSPEELNEIKHYFINSHSVTRPVNAGLFEKYALDAVENIFLQHDVAVMVGGTGLYINAFCNGIDEMPEIDGDIRNGILLNFERNGIKWLQGEVEKKDPKYYRNGEIKNPRRLMRALEITLSTGRSIMEYQTKQKRAHHFNIIKIGLHLPKEKLHHKINERVDIMMQQGLTDEVRSLLPLQNLPALQTVGYTELFEHINGKIPLDEAVEKIRLNTRHYAKRQVTWFKKDKEINFLDAEDKQLLMENCLQLINAGGNVNGL